MIIGQEMADIRHGVGRCTVAIFGVVRCGYFFRSWLANTFSLRTLYPAPSRGKYTIDKQLNRLKYVILSLRGVRRRHFGLITIVPRRLQERQG